jgi:hypothetical protein
MQKPRRRNLRNAIEGFASSHGIGVIWILKIPTICSENVIERATGGCTKPFELWKRRRYSTTKKAIMAKSRSGWSDEYISTLEQVVSDKPDDIFEYSIEPDNSAKPFSELYWA